MASKKLFFEKFKEAAASVLPIVVIVAVMCLSFVPMQADLMLSFVIGSVMLIVGMGLFTLGSEVSMTPIGTHMGAKLTKSRNLTLILVVSFLLGIAVTVSEPDLTVRGVAFYDGVTETPAITEAARWIDCIINDKELYTKPEQACVVSEILEAIYTSNKTGQPVYFD